MKLGMSWTQLKEIVTKKNLSLQYDEIIWSDSYYVFSTDGIITYEARVLKDAGSDVTDFEANYKANCNHTIGSFVTTPTYSASTIKVVPDAAGPKDMFTLTGSATKVVRLVRIWVTGVQTTASALDIKLIKRSTANSGGTSEVVSAVPHDSLSPAATAVMRAYTVNATNQGTQVGSLGSRKIMIPAAGDKTPTPTPAYEAIVPSQAIVLRGTSEVVAVNFCGDVITGGKINCSFEWTEEA